MQNKKNQSKIIKINDARHLVITPKARVSFPQLFVPRSFQDSAEQKKEFKVDLIFDSKEAFKEKGKGKKGETPSMLGAFANARADQWGSDKAKWPKFAHTLFKDGNERTNADGEIYQGYAGKVFVTAKSGEKFPPKVLKADGTPAEEKDIYGGCFARAALLARPYMFGKNFGIRFILLQLQKVGNGERFGGVQEDLFDVAEMEDEDMDVDAIGEDNEDGDDF